MDLKYHGDKLDQTGLMDQTELNSHSEKLELSVVFIYEQFSIISKIIQFCLVNQTC